MHEESGDDTHQLLKENILERDQEIVALDQERQKMKSILREAISTLLEFYNGLECGELDGEALLAQLRMEDRMKD